MSVIDSRPDLAGAAKVLAEARDSCYSDPITVVVNVQSLETKLGEVEVYPGAELVWNRLCEAIAGVEEAGGGDVDFAELDSALSTVESVYEELVTIVLATEQQ